MKQMRRSPVALLLALLLVLTLVGGIAVTAYARACSHVYGTPTITVRYAEKNSSGHTVITTTTKVCRVCGHVDETVTSVRESHDIHMYDLGHNLGQATHTFHWRCDICLWVQRTQTIPCEGPPCPAPYGFQLRPEVQ